MIDRLAFLFDLRYTSAMPFNHHPRTVYLIRHATPDWANHSLPYDVPPGPTLTAQGRQEAHLLASHMTRAGIGHIFSSEMARAKETADILGQRLSLPVEIEPGLIEIPAGETREALAQRMASLWQRRVLDDAATQPIALVSHGGPIEALLRTVAHPPLDLQPYKQRFDRQNPLPPAGVWELTRQPDDTWQATLVFFPLARA